VKIALVSLQFEETATGGGGVHVAHICEQFLRSGLDVTVISIHTEKTLQGARLKGGEYPFSVRTRDGLKVIRFLIDSGIEQPYEGTKDEELGRIKCFADTVVRWLKDSPEEFDIINLHGHHILPGYMAKELRGTGPEVISTIHALETTYTTGKGEFVGAFEGTSELLDRISEWEAMARYADHVIVNSPIVRNEFKEIIGKFDEDAGKYAERIILISSGCNEDFLISDEQVEQKLGKVPERVNLVTFCRIDPSKGVEFSINGAKTAARLSSYRFSLTIAGIPSSDAYITQLKKEAEDTPGNLEVKFKLRSAISPQAEKKEILDDKHIYILPTLKEPFGMSVIEASARGNMIVSADTNGPKFMFESDSGRDRGWGIVTEYGVMARITEDHRVDFAENIGRAIVWTVDNWQTGVRRVLKFNEKIRNTWTWESIARQYMELFQQP